MSKRPAKPAESPWLIPYLCVKDPDQSLDFYQRAFGFEKKFTMPGPNGKTAHAEMTYRAASIMFGPEGPHSPCRAPANSGVPSPVNLYVYCDDVDALYKRAVSAGAKGDMSPADMFYGDRVCKLTDPDGHVWSFATNVADFDPAKAPTCHEK